MATDYGAMAEQAIFGSPRSTRTKPSGDQMIDVFDAIGADIAGIDAKASEALTTAIASDRPPKAAVRVMATANVNIASGLVNGATLNGVTLATGDRVFLPFQTNGATVTYDDGTTNSPDNGIRVVQASGAAPRSTDMDSGDEVLGARFFVQAGTLHAGTTWACTTAGPITVGTTGLSFANSESQTAVSAALVTTNAEIAAARNGKSALKVSIDQMLPEQGVNVFIGGLLDRGVLNPDRVNASAVVDLPLSSKLRDLGLTKGFLFPASAEYLRFVVPDELKEYFLGKYVAVGMIGETAQTFPPYAIARVEGAASVNNTISGNTNSYFTLGTNVRALYQYGQMPSAGSGDFINASDLKAIRVGYSSNASTDFYVTAFFIAISSAPFDVRRLPFLRRALGDVAPPTVATGPILTLDGKEPNSGSIEADNGEIVVKRAFQWSTTPAIILPNGVRSSWSQTADYIDGQLYRGMTDDEGPYLVNGAHMGGQHQFGGGLVTATSHGKDATDIGQVLKNGGNSYVILAVINSNSLVLARRGASALPPTGTYTYDSGGTHTGNITVSGTPAVQNWSPMGINKAVAVSIDNAKKVRPVAGVSPYVARTTITESYDVLDRETVLDWIVAHGGISGLTGSPLFSVSNSYSYDRDGGLTLAMDFIVRQTLTLGWIYGLQVQLSSALYWYIPKTTPFTQDATPYNFAMIQPAVAPATELQFTTANTVAGGLFLDRFITMNDSYGMAVGFVPVQAAEPTVRRSTYVPGSNIGMTIATTGKGYLRILNQGGSSKSAGFQLGWVGYRNLFKRSSVRTCAYPVRTNDADYFYADWHDKAFVDTIALPPDFHGRPMTIVEKSATVTLLSDQNVAGARIMVDVSASGSYGYLVLKFTK